MATNKFKTQLESLNAAALYFGSKGYHVEVSIYGKTKAAILTIFYTRKTQAQEIKLQLSMYKEEGDVLEHQYYPNVTDSKGFHIMRLRKEEL